MTLKFEMKCKSIGGIPDCDIPNFRIWLRKGTLSQNIRYKINLYIQLTSFWSVYILELKLYYLHFVRYDLIEIIDLLLLVESVARKTQIILVVLGFKGASSLLQDFLSIYPFREATHHIGWSFLDRVQMVSNRFVVLLLLIK